MRPQFVSEDQFAAMQKRVRKVGPVNAGADLQGAGHARKVSSVISSPHYRSKWELNFANKLELEQRAGMVKAWWYEPFSLWLPGKIRYKPDFLVQYEPMHRMTIGSTDFRLEIIEVKGFSKNRRDGMTRLKMAAALFPCFVWRIVYRTKGGGWNGEYL